MAAYHITSLPNADILKLLDISFWSLHYLNTWMMYIGITDGNDPVLKELILSDIRSPLGSRSNISNKIQINKLQYLFLFCCMMEVDNHMSHSVKFRGGNIDLSNQALSTGDLYTITVLLLKLPNKQWKGLNLSNCNIDGKIDNIIAVLPHNTKLQQLYFSVNNLQTEGAIKFARSLQNTTTLTEFGLSNNNIECEAADDIAIVLSNNTKLQKLYLKKNTLQTEGAIKIARSLQNTTTLTEFGLSNNSIGCEAADDIAIVLSNKPNCKNYTLKRTLYKQKVLLKLQGHYRILQL